jgi:hypothetical protein
VLATTPYPGSQLSGDISLVRSRQEEKSCQSIASFLPGWHKSNLPRTCIECRLDRCLPQQLHRTTKIITQVLGTLTALNARVVLTGMSHEVAN